MHYLPPITLTMPRLVTIVAHALHELNDPFLLLPGSVNVNLLPTQGFTHTNPLSQANARSTLASL